MAEKPKLQFRACIHDTPASLRFGGDEAYVTLMVPASDAEKAAVLIGLKKTPLVVTIQVDDGSKTDEKNNEETGEAEPASGRRPWLERGRRKANG